MADCEAGLVPDGSEHEEDNNRNNSTETALPLLLKLLIFGHIFIALTLAALRIFLIGSATLYTNEVNQQQTPIVEEETLNLPFNIGHQEEGVEGCDISLAENLNLNNPEQLFGITFKQQATLDRSEHHAMSNNPMSPNHSVSNQNEQLPELTFQSLRPPEVTQPASTEVNERLNYSTQCASQPECPENVETSSNRIYRTSTSNFLKVYPTSNHSTDNTEIIPDRTKKNSQQSSNEQDITKNKVFGRGNQPEEPTPIITNASNSGAPVRDLRPNTVIDDASMVAGENRVNLRGANQARKKSPSRSQKDHGARETLHR